MERKYVVDSCLYNLYDFASEFCIFDVLLIYKKKKRCGCEKNKSEARWYRKKF